MDVFCLHEIYTKIYVFCVIYLLTSHRWTSVGITTCFFVPEGFRPKIKCGSACYTDDDVNFNNIGAVKIDTNGDITIYFPTVYSTCVYTSIVYDID